MSDWFTNKTVKVFRTQKSWDQKETTELVGSYSAWVEEGSVYTVLKTEGSDVTIGLLGKGTVFFWDKVDLEGCYLEFDSERKEIVSVSILEDENGFDHMEVGFK